MIGIIISVGIASVIIFIIIKLIKNSNKTGYMGKTNHCMACGRKTNLLICQFCKKNSKSLR